jgi:hypothetical protein
MKILYIFHFFCPLFEIIDRLIDWCLTSSEQFFSYIQDDFWNKVAKYFNGPSMINNPQNRTIGKNKLKLNEKKCHLFMSKTNLFKKFKSNTDQQSWTFGKNALKLNEKIINFTFLCQKQTLCQKVDKFSIFRIFGRYIEFSFFVQSWFFFKFIVLRAPVCIFKK